MKVLSTEEHASLAKKHKANVFDVQAKATELRACHSEVERLSENELNELIENYQSLGKFYGAAMLWFVKMNRTLNAYEMTDLLIALTLSDSEGRNRYDKPISRADTEKLVRR